MDDRGTFLPPALARLVESNAQSHTLEHELFQLFLRGRRRITLGLGPGVDLPLLPEELARAGLDAVSGGRALVVTTVRADPEGYTVERAVTNFGLFVRNPSTGNWINVPQGGEQRNLVPGDVIGLGSTPADCVKVTLPEGPWISTATLPRSGRHAVLDQALAERAFHLPDDAHKVTPDTPPTVGPHRHYTPRSPPGAGNPSAKVTPPGANRSGPIPTRPRADATARTDAPRAERVDGRAADARAVETPRPAPRAPEPRERAGERAGPVLSGGPRDRSGSLRAGDRTAAPGSGPFLHRLGPSAESFASSAADPGAGREPGVGINELSARAAEKSKGSGPLGTGPLGSSGKLPSREYEPLFRAALLHWRYAMVTFGGDPKSVVHLPDPALVRLRAALLRNCDQPERGYELFVKDPDPDLWVEPRGEPMVSVRRGGAVKLRGPGNKLGFGRFVLELPAPAVVTPRFGPRVVPSAEEIAEVLGLALADLADPEAVKARHRELARRFHPDRADGDPGHTSRFVEIQAAFDAWKAR